MYFNISPNLAYEVRCNLKLIFFVKLFSLILCINVFRFCLLKELFFVGGGGGV